MLSHTGCDQGRRVRGGGGGWLNSDPWVLGSTPGGPQDQYRNWPATLATVVDLDLVRVILYVAGLGSRHRVANAHIG
jgi:hypothetical protein